MFVYHEMPCVSQIHILSFILKSKFFVGLYCIIDVKMRITIYQKHVSFALSEYPIVMFQFRILALLYFFY